MSLCIVGPDCLHVCMLLKHYCLCTIDRDNPDVCFDPKYNQVTGCSCRHSTFLTSTSTIIKQPQLLLLGCPALGSAFLLCPWTSQLYHCCVCRLQGPFQPNSSKVLWLYRPAGDVLHSASALLSFAAVPFFYKLRGADIVPCASIDSSDVPQLPYSAGIEHCKLVQMPGSCCSIAGQRSASFRLTGEAIASVSCSQGRSTQR